jgi:hypothetical protein
VKSNQKPLKPNEPRKRPSQTATQGLRFLKGIVGRDPDHFISDILSPPPTFHGNNLSLRRTAGIRRALDAEVISKRAEEESSLSYETRS